MNWLQEILAALASLGPDPSIMAEIAADARTENAANKAAGRVILDGPGSPQWVISKYRAKLAARRKAAR